jgi:hypothetical protein
MKSTYQVRPPTAVHLPPHFQSPDTDRPQSRLAEIVCQVKRVDRDGYSIEDFEADGVIEGSGFDRAPEPARFSAECLEKLQREGSHLLNLIPQGFIPDGSPFGLKTDHTTEAYETYVAYCDYVRVAPHTPEYWFEHYAVVPRFPGETGRIGGRPLVPFTIKNGERIGLGIVTERMLQGAEVAREIEDEKPLNLEPLRQVRESQFVSAEFRNRNQALQDELQPACLTRKPDTPITFDGYVARAAYRAGQPEQFEQVTEKTRKGADGKPDKHAWQFLYNLPLRIKAPSQKMVWCSKCAEYVAQDHFLSAEADVEGLQPGACEQTCDAGPVSYYKTATGQRETDLFKIAARKEREAERIVRIEDFEAEVNPAFARSLHKTCFLNSRWDKEPEPAYRQEKVVRTTPHCACHVDILVCQDKCKHQHCSTCLDILSAWNNRQAELNKKAYWEEIARKYNVTKYHPGSSRPQHAQNKPPDIRPFFETERRKTTSPVVKRPLHHYAVRNRFPGELPYPLVRPVQVVHGTRPQESAPKKFVVTKAQVGGTIGRWEGKEQNSQRFPQSYISPGREVANGQ